MKTEKININDLKPAPYNPRIMPEGEMEKLKKGLNTFGLIDPIIIDLTDNNTVIGGHQRLEALKEIDIEPELTLIRLGDVGLVLKETDIKIKDKNQQKAMNLALNKISGTWDYKKLDDVLMELSEENYQLELTGFDAEEIDLNFDYEPLDFEDETRTIKQGEYSTKIDAPIYQIKGECPSIEELFSDKMYNKLLKKINLIEDENLKNFLQYSATRHISFNFSKIAEFYAHQSKEVQNIMEDLCLIIIDFDKAIEKGFVQISEEYQKQLKGE